MVHYIGIHLRVSSDIEMELICQVHKNETDDAGNYACWHQHIAQRRNFRS